VFLCLYQVVAKDVIVTVAVAKARLSAADGAEDGAKARRLDGTPLEPQMELTWRFALKSTISALAPSVFKGPRYNWRLGQHGTVPAQNLAE
jgi:hypothetical protein